jgi:hypothetical protein
MTPPDSVICTLFEGHYHYGVAALVNSLYKNGFRGDVYIGYRGDLPVWVSNTKSNDTLNWKGAVTMMAATGLQLHFLPIQTDWHLANYKPVFILDVQRCTNTSIFYFDPDITVKCNWKFFEEWIGYGVAVVQEIISNNFSPTHPKRMQYDAVIKQSNREIKRPLYHGLNSGFCGVSVSNIDFLETWKDITITAIRYFNFESAYFVKHMDKSRLFIAGDQDMMNMAAMCCRSAISDVGPEGMDFVPGGWLMSHVTGNPKPWNKNFFLSCIRGFPPLLAEKAYWSNVNGPIRAHSRAYIKFKRFCILCAAFAGRFYKRY